jgi:hypothetical protein
MLACVYLGAAIHNRDVEDVQRAASDVVEAWLGMRSERLEPLAQPSLIPLHCCALHAARR